MMVDKFFGLYLLAKGLLNRQQLLDIVSVDEITIPCIELLVIQAGVMKLEQVKAVQEEQWRTNKKFLEIAYEKKFLTIAQIEEVYFTHPQNALVISQLALDRGYLTLAQWNKAQEDYNRECNLLRKKFDDFRDLDYNALVRILLHFNEDVAHEELYYNYVALLLRNIVRFLEHEPSVVQNTYLTDKKMFSAETPSWTVLQEIRIGNKQMNVELNLNEKAMICLAKDFSKESITQVDSYTMDCVTEFFNVHNGIFTININNSGTEAKLGSPRIEATHGELPSPSFHVPISLGDYQFNLLVHICKSDAILPV